MIKQTTRGTLVALLTTMALSGCGAEPNDPAPSSSTAAETPLETSIEMPALVARMDALDVAKFVEQPRIDQLAYVSILIQAYSDDYEEIMGANEWYSAWTEPSETNSDREIVDNLNRVLQFTRMSPVDHSYTGPDGEEWSAAVDTLQGVKMLSGARTEITPDNGEVGNLAHDITSYPSMAASVPAGRYYEMTRPDFIGSNFPCTDSLTETEQVCRSMDVSHGDDEGSLRAMLTPFVDAETGVDRYMWLAVVR